MLESIDEFAVMLRRAGLRISIAEVADACVAAGEVGVSDPKAFRLALRASLVKSRSAMAVFDELFELFFVRVQPLWSASSLAGELPDLANRSELVDFLACRLRDEAAGLSPLARMLLGISTPEVGALIRSAGLAQQLSMMANPLQIGFFAYRLQRALGVPVAEASARAALGRIVADLDLSEADAAALAGGVSKNAAALREAVRDYVDAEFARRNADFVRRSKVRALADRPLVTLSPAEVQSLREEVERLAELLRARIRRKPKKEQRGRLDLRRTLRHSLASDGTPVELIMRRKRRHKPRLVVLCDVSDSVRHVSDFMLQFVYTLVDRFDRVDAFAFVEDIAEVGSLFRDQELESAIELVHQGGAVNVFANSNFGRAFENFRERHFGKVTSRSTVLIIGDGRTNYHPPRADIVDEIRRRARRLVWLTPEGPQSWGFGDSAMAEYAPNCDEVAVVRDLTSLRTVIDELLVHA